MVAIAPVLRALESALGEDKGGPRQGPVDNDLLKIEFQANNDWNLEMFKSVISNGQGALRSATLINGGAAVAVLSQVGSGAVPSPTGLIFFCAGVLTASIAAGATYIGQSLFFHRKNRWGDMFRVVTVLLVIGSYVSFALGACACFSAFGE